VQLPQETVVLSMALQGVHQKENNFWGEVRISIC
jgi:hypothetical protein